MDQAFDLASVRNTLRKGIAKGYWTLETLDKPSAHFVANTALDRKTFPGGYTGVQFKNLLRDDPQPPTPEARPATRDFEPPTPEFDF